MKTYINYLIGVLVFLLLISTTDELKAQRKRNANRNAEKVIDRCEGIDYNDRVRISITRFSVSNRKAQAQFGEEIATILSNALVETNCYQVLSSVTNRGDWEVETRYGAEGNTVNGTSPEMGQALGPQLVVVGEITEYQDEFVAVGPVGVQRAQIGFVIQVINPETRAILFSRSFDKRKNKPGAATGIKLLGRTVTGVNLKTQAMADILEEALLEASGVLVTEKDNLVAAVGVPNQMTAAKVFNRENCLALADGSPSIMVIIPEVHISRPAPDPAGETEIIKKLISAGFRVIDPSVYDGIRNNEQVNAASKDAGAAATLGAEYGADIIIIGEAFSEMTNRSNNMFSCRARVEARAVSTANATILGADGQHAGGTDVSELTSAKIALRNAGSQMGDYFLETLCENGVGSASVGNGGNKTLNINLTNASFSALSQLEKALRSHSSVREVKKSLSGNLGSLIVEYQGSVDPLAELIAGGAGVDVEVTEFSETKIGLLVK